MLWHEAQTAGNVWFEEADGLQRVVVQSATGIIQV